MSKTILIVDDEKDVLATIVYTLKRTGHTLLTATNGEEGLALAKEKKPDLIILDLVLPKMDGIRFGNSVKECEGLEDIPIILMTASVEDIENKTEKARATDYVLKPFDPKELAEIIDKYLGP